MKFRFKVLFINIIILSIALGCVGYLMIRQNFQLAYNAQIRSAIEEHNLIQASLEYRILDILYTDDFLLEQELTNIAERTASDFMSTSSMFLVRYNDTDYYKSTPDFSVPEAMLNHLEPGMKHYYVEQHGQEYYAYVAALSSLDTGSLYIISRKDITDAYALKDRQFSYFNLLILCILFLGSMAIYLLAYILTKPMEQLNRISDRFAAGDYSARSNIHTKDEIGMLSDKYNHMAEAVSSHITELNRMIKQREQFVADFTHELKTPMTSIIGYADTIRSKELSRANQIMAADYIFTEGKRLEALSMKLFDLIYLNQRDIPMSRLHTAKLGNDIVKIMEPILSTHNMKLSFHFEDAVITGDSELLETVFINLIDNARKASKPESLIDISGQRQKDEYIFRVTDHGIGISKEHLNYIFDEFYMVDRSRSRKAGGAGLGLSLSALIINRHHAQIQIESAPGKGTTVIVTFHLEQEETNEKK